VKIERNPTNCT